MSDPSRPRPKHTRQTTDPAGGGAEVASAASTLATRASALVLIVTGSTLQAEIADRPLAYRLRDRLLAWRNEAAGNGSIDSSRLDFDPIVCSDLWYLNSHELQERPTVAIGDPHTNAATAMIASRLPTAFVIEGSLRVHLDPEFIDLRVALWGADPAATASAIDFFVQRYLGEFLDAA